ncbi:uncharacterized protein LOC111302918 [Durio zibethinus]|uniref:Uncharacterized protein LOC111302918 n=1 Tax=Durio zibethinus TaxID=66656 RepID=A0A6P5ZP26_DURZI|nr:uncharacterized protein LOC111302918 [Durio zibethinus]
MELTIHPADVTGTDKGTCFILLKIAPPLEIKNPKGKFLKDSPRYIKIRTVRDSSPDRNVKCERFCNVYSTAKFSSTVNSVKASISMHKPHSTSTPRAPTLKSDDHWAKWTSPSLPLVSEKTKVGSALSGAIVGALIGLGASNLDLISCDPKAYSVVLEFLLPLAVPLLLFRADLRRLLLCFALFFLHSSLLGSVHDICFPYSCKTVATTVRTTLAYLIVPMRALGQDSWKIAAALMDRHIGGAVNDVAISNALGVSPSILAAGLAADNAICAVYFTSSFALASKVPLETSASTDDVVTAEGSESGGKLPVLKIATALAVSFTICKIGAFLANYFWHSGR